MASNSPTCGRTGLRGVLLVVTICLAGGLPVQARNDAARPPHAGPVTSAQHNRVVTRTVQVKQAQVRRVPIRVSRPSRGQRWVSPPRGANRLSTRSFPLQARWQTDPRTYAVYSINNHEVWYLDPTTGWAYTVDRWGVVYSADPRQGFVYSLGELARWTADLLYFFDYFSYDRGYWQPNYYARYWGAWNAPRGLFFDYGGAYDCLWGYDYYFVSQTFVAQTVTFSQTYVHQVHQEVIYEREHPQHMREQVQAVGVAAMTAGPPAQISAQTVATAATVEVADVGTGENATVVPVVDGESAALVEPLADDVPAPAGATDLGVMPVDPLPIETATNMPETTDGNGAGQVVDDVSTPGAVDTALSNTQSPGELNGENAAAPLPGAGDESSLPQAYVAPPAAETAGDPAFQTDAPPALNDAPSATLEPQQAIDEQQDETSQTYDAPAQQPYEQQPYEPPAQSYEPPPQQSYEQQQDEAPQAYEPPAQSYEPPQQQSYEQQQYEAPQAYEPPAQSYEPPPQQSYEQQQYEAPQAYEPPAQSYEPPPQQSYEQQQYEAPQAYEPPAQSYEPPPQQSYEQQQYEAPQAYEPPAQSYEPPPQQSYEQQQYEAPQAYEPPAQSYEPPPQQSYEQQQYEAPQAYEPPAQSYEPPSQQSYEQQQYEAPQAYEPPPQSYEPPPQMDAPAPAQEEAPAASEEEQTSE